jgi:hypothetical protein
MAVEDLGGVKTGLTSMALRAPDQLRKFAAEMNRSYAVLATNHATMNEIDKCMQLAANTNNFEDCFKASRKYIAKTALADYNFNEMAIFMAKYLKSNISETSALFASSRLSANGMRHPGETRLASDTNTYLARIEQLEAVVAAQAAQAALGATATPTGRGANGAQPAYVLRKDRYCFAHGKCEHPSTDCKFMRSGKPNPKTGLPFTNAMKNAISFAAVPGGNPN